MQIKTSNKALDGARSNLNIRCVSDESITPERVDDQVVVVNFIDECYGLTIDPAQVESFGGVLNSYISGAISPLGSVDLAGCPEPFYLLEGPVETTASRPA